MGEGAFSFVGRLGCIAFYGMMICFGMGCLLNEAFLLWIRGFLCLEGLGMREENMEWDGGLVILFPLWKARRGMGVAFTNGVLRRNDYMNRGVGREYILV